MVKRFKMDVQVHPPGPHGPVWTRTLDAPLESRQCSSHNQNGNQCRRRCVIGFEKCWMHLRNQDRLRIMDSPHGGKGLFAYDNTLPANDHHTIVFRPLGQNSGNVNPIAAAVNAANRGYITEYKGQLITAHQHDVRYPSDYIHVANPGLQHPLDTLAPYTLAVRDPANHMIDAALLRGVASMANHGPMHGVVGVGANANFRRRVPGVGHPGPYPLNQRMYVGAIRPIRNRSEILIHYGNQYNVHNHPTCRFQTR